ncbi:MAG: ABC transporter permease [Candidatus Marinimicrobia bacterium]|nr:ABC transporter permease [Candidatus Neomarinimicrobiota bacterium]
MLGNYLKVAFRSIARNRTYSIINVLGLAFGMAAFTLLALLTYNELRYDRYHVKGDRIYRMALAATGNTLGSGSAGVAKIPGPWGPTARRKFRKWSGLYDSHF